MSALAACSSSANNNPGGDDDTTTGPGGGDAGGDASVNNRVTGDAGQCLANCHEGDPCSTGAQCASGTCTANACVDPSCTDGKQDGTETASDCGGICAACADGLSCKIGGDCESGVCDATTKLCDAPSATDMVKNGNETAVDCGSSGTGEPDNAPPCPDGSACNEGSDCVDKECGNGTCTPATCSDTMQNGSETDLNCGGMCMPCVDGKMCLVDADCTSKSCDTSGTHTCLAPTDTDMIANGNETDTDCGSSGTGEATHASPCIDGKMCITGVDCVDKVCGADKTCSKQACNDGVQNGDETGVDCGDHAATGCNACGDGQGCSVATDCTSLSCSTTTHLCLAPTSTDGILNGNESDVDCGSSGTGENTMAPACADVNKKTGTISVCAAAADCKSTFCNTTEKQCVDGNSCSLPAASKSSPIQDISVQAVTSGANQADAVGVLNMNGAGLVAGIDTCGKGEATDDAALTAHDSCCKSLDLTVPAEAKTIRIDKYEVTTGRMRQFVETVNALEGGYNIQKWVKDQITAKTPAGNTMAAQFPTTQTGGTDTRALFPTELGGDLGLAQQLGGTSMDDGVPSPEQGCYMGNGQYAASTYWFDKEDGSLVGAPPRAFTQDYYDIKPQNCIPYWMTVAFCAWDGGQLPTKAEYDYLWGTAAYPWGASSRTYETIGAPPAGTLYTNWTVDNLNDDGTKGFFYLYPTANGDTAANPSNPDTGPLSFKSIIDTTSTGYDNTPFIAAPGRFTTDVTTLTALTGTSWAGESWYDVAANLMEYEAIPAANFVPTSNVAEFCDTSNSVAESGGTCPAGYNCMRNSNPGSCGIIRGSGNPVVSVMPRAAWNGGSWEVHAIQQDGYNEPMQTQYGKAGFRCARAVE